MAFLYLDACLWCLGRGVITCRLWTGDCGKKVQVGHCCIGVFRVPVAVAVIFPVEPPFMVDKFVWGQAADMGLVPATKCIPTFSLEGSGPGTRRRAMRVPRESRIGKIVDMWHSLTGPCLFLLFLLSFYFLCLCSFFFVHTYCSYFSCVHTYLV